MKRYQKMSWNPVTVESRYRRHAMKLTEAITQGDVGTNMLPVVKHLEAAADAARAAK